jgi:hypothetical protein
MSKKITKTEGALKECPNPRIKMIYADTGETFTPRCKSYDCEFCGPINKRNLQNYIITQLVTEYGVIIMITISLRAGLGHPPNSGKKDWEFHYKILQECYRLYNTEVRRGTLNEKRGRKSDNKKDVHIIRLNETMGSGQPHIHAMIDKFIDQKQAYQRFNQVAKSVLMRVYSEKGWDTTEIENLKSFGTINFKFICRNTQFADTRDKLKKITRYVTKQLDKDMAKQEELAEKEIAITSYITKNVNEIIADPEKFKKAAEKIDRQNATGAIKEKINNVEEYSKFENKHKCPYKRKWSKSNNLPKKNNNEKIQAKLIIKNIKTGRETINLYYKAQLRIEEGLEFLKNIKSSVEKQLFQKKLQIFKLKPPQEDNFFSLTTTFAF